MHDCLFCKIINNEIPAEFLYQDDKIVVFKDIRPKARVHLLLVSKEHIKNLTQANESNNELLAHMLLMCQKLATQQGLIDGFRTVINTGAGGGQEIDHLHFHLLGGNLPKM